MDQHIAFITYETSYAPGGGIAAVMAHLPQAVQSISQIPTFVITPFHFKIEKTNLLEPRMDTIAILAIPFNSELIKVEVKVFQDEISWIFLKPQISDTNMFPLFAGGRHPYDVPKIEQVSYSILLRDSLFFGRAASSALAEICPACSWTVLMQDWEAATCMLSFLQNKSHKPIPSSFLTLHNSYDSGINQESLKVAGLDNVQITGHTVLETALPHINDPIFTVSDQFALDLSNEIFQTEIMIPHIVNQLTPRLYGINNGPFIEGQIPERVFKAGLDGDTTPLSDWKEKKRSQAVKIIRKFSPNNDELVWGDVDEFSGKDLPWFLIAGRDDSRQKGYEVACLAVEKFFEQGGQACFIFFPIPGDEGLNGIQFIEELALKYPKYVLGFPFLFREGYFPIMQGATFGMMPSYYEPFGMANEFFLNGVSCVGRATGGIIQQIVPYRDAKSFGEAVSSRSERWHAADSKPSGFLFREEDGIPSALDDWEEINAADYSIDLKGKNRLGKRANLSLIKEMSKEMSSCLQDAVTLYESDRDKYLEFIINGAAHIHKNFSWEKSAKKYIEKVIS